jgi:catechol 2,3-dioxygenase-like lactoylglutathione lyase family enzyme
LTVFRSTWYDAEHRQEESMETVISQLLKDFEGGKMSRRQLIQSLALAALAGSAAGSAGAQTRNGFTTMHLDHISYLVPDYRRARDFYAGLMGMAVVGDNGKDYCQLQFGDARVDGARARAFVSVRNTQAQAGQPANPGPRLDHVAFKIDNWDTNRVKAELERRGLKPRLQAGGPGDTPNYVSFHVTDPDGFEVQISGIAGPGDALYKKA